MIFSFEISSVLRLKIGGIASWKRGTSATSYYFLALYPIVNEFLLNLEKLVHSLKDYYI